MATHSIIIGLASCGISAGGLEILSVFENYIKEKKSPIALSGTGCIGACFREVIVELQDDSGSHMYGNVTPEIALNIIRSHIENGEVLTEHIIKNPDADTESAFFSKQRRFVLRNTGIINPEKIQDYIERGGYAGLRKALLDMNPAGVRETVSASGLRGRGGGGFPTGRKWELAAAENSDEKYIICNADEGDPGAFMDRSVLEGDPHSVLEGLAIGGYAIGADTGIIYARAEYPLAIARLKTAISQAEEKNLLGSNIFGSAFSFQVKLKIGAGAFVCGEETALMASVEGKRGMPRVRPPFPAQKGVWDKPTIINNVETLASVPVIISRGAEEYAGIGTEKSRGTKVFALTGKIKKSGLVEVPMGISLREVIYDIGGGIKGDKQFKAVQLGGPSGGCIPVSLIDTPVDYESLKDTGAIMGSGGMVVMDESTCMVDIARFFMKFIRDESCGKCTFCRIGTKRMHEILEKITAGKGEEKDLDRLQELALRVREASLCGLGQTAPNPVLTTLRYFREEYLEHINEKKCRAAVCRPLLTYTIDPEKCTGCGLCARKCPTDAISGEKKQIHLIDQQACIKCGSCFTVCNFSAVIVK